MGSQLYWELRIPIELTCQEAKRDLYQMLIADTFGKLYHSVIRVS